MATYQSVQSATGTTSVVITKPTSLAVGDLMLAGILGSNNGTNTVTLQTLAGWTAEELVVVGADELQVGVYSKVADSSDVAASNFTFTSNGGSGSRNMIGHILRFTNYAFKDGEASSQTNAGGTTLSFSGLTPTYANDTFVFFSGIDSSVSQYSTSSYEMATSNPTWTERAESTYNNTTRDSALGVATASRPEVTATGNFTATYDVSTSGMRAASIVIALAGRVDGTLSAPEIRSIGYVFSPIQSTVAQANAVSPTTEVISPTVWTPTPKS